MQTGRNTSPRLGKSRIFLKLQRLQCLCALKTRFARWPRRPLLLDHRPIRCVHDQLAWSPEGIAQADPNRFDQLILDIFTLLSEQRPQVDAPKAILNIPIPAQEESEV
jgi:hypothetical protein